MHKLILPFLILSSIFLFGQKKNNDSTNWQTFFEKSNFLETPDYNETINFFKRIEKSSPYGKLIEFGVTPQGRKIYVFAASKLKKFTAKDFANSNKPLLLIMNGIHSGEINGKDASMILLREILISKEKFELLDNVNLLVIPVFNIDGHERISEFNRINQIGPKKMGWRTTSQNYNLNRDFLKADAPEMKHFLKLFSTWMPDVFIDVHSTDGADFQYQTTITAEKHENVAKSIAEWTREKFLPYIFESVKKKGFMISPFAGFINDDPKNGLRDWVASPRFSNGYAAVQNRIGLLIESHVRKTYKERVFSTKAVLESVIELMNKNATELKSVIENGEKEIRTKYFQLRKGYPIRFKLTDESDDFNFEGIEYDLVESKIAGDKVKVFTGEKFSKKVPYFNHSEVTQSVVLPDAYLIPHEYKKFADILKLHGVKVDSLKEDKELNAERILFTDVKFSKNPFESHFIPNYNFTTEKIDYSARVGDFVINADQRTLGILVYLLEPASDESFVKWGMMNEIFEQKEYFEEYAMEPIASKMYNENPELKKEFDEKIISDSTFAKSPYERLNFFYKKSEYYDKKLNVYPILRIDSK